MNSSAYGELETTGFEEAAERHMWKSDSHEILSFLKNTGESACLRGGTRTALAYLLARGLKLGGKPLVLVAPNDREAEELAETVSFFRGKESTRQDSPLDRRVWYLPSRTGHKVQLLGKMEATARRLETLYALRTSSAPILVVTSALAMVERLVPPVTLLAGADYKVAGDRMDLESLCRRLADRGYYRASLVEEYGDFSRRGGVLDIYAPFYRWPLRLEFFGDELESIRLFHPSSQRSMGALEDAVLLPVSEIIMDDAGRELARKAVYDDIHNGGLTAAAGNVWLEKIQEGYQFGAFESVLSIFHDGMATLFDYLDPRTVLIWSDTAQVRREMEEHYWRVCREWEETHSPNEWKRPPAELFEEPEKIYADGARFQQLWVSPLTEQSSSARVFELGARTHEELALSVKSHSGKDRLLEPLARQFLEWQKEGVSSFLVCRHKEQSGRLAELLGDYGVDTISSEMGFGEESGDAPAVKVLVGSLTKGFLWLKERLAVVSEEEIFGKRPQRRGRKPVSGIFLSSFQDVRVGDYIVHVDHGIGIYKELAHLNVGGIENDFLLLGYQDGDRLYVPVDKLQKVQKYLGIEGQEPRVDRLGGKSWETAKKKARESAERIAGELLKLYALRQVKEGHQYSPPDQYFREFEATFSYEETADQMRAIDDVIEDLASPRPMDRLICGDVGYGKTEVALRAAFKVAMDGRQVALLVPTTVLAEQHYQTFRERFEGFPVEVATLSRFKTPAQQKQVIDRLQKGTIDVVVGTHRLLQQDVVFKDLGLLVIDEEHRFGVKHKERLKELRVSVDVLTLTATPIPRTLHMAMAGIRDLSTIETAPQDRRSIESYVCKYDEFTIREAVYRELHRGGQIFFVHNHVQSIYQMAGVLGKLAPEARIAVAHGQMKERELEKVMLEFVHRKVDILVCTTIIESGLDIPAANTIIINRADKFGLAQIYQLRGRVGRSSEQAYAYLLIPGEHLISRDAQKRLRALMDFSELGSGFRIALNDLQIRGGGTILGSAQSGHVAAVGYELYLELLEETVRELKGEKDEGEHIDPEINVPLSAFLPEGYIPDTDQRLLAYKRLASASEDADVDDLTAEWRDRYGPFPESVKSLILLAKLRSLFKRLGISRMDGGEGDALVLHFTSRDGRDRLLRSLDGKKCTYVAETELKLRMEVWARNPAQRLARLKRVLQELRESDSHVKSIQ